MTITGYWWANPFRNGHKYLLDQAEGPKIVAMFKHAAWRACYRDKWTRAQMALENGADLVVELPFSQCSGGRFLWPRSCGYLGSFGHWYLAFGTEVLKDIRTYTEQQRNGEICGHHLIHSPTLRNPSHVARICRSRFFRGNNHPWALAHAGRLWTQHQTSSDSAVGAG